MPTTTKLVTLSAALAAVFAVACSSSSNGDPSLPTPAKQLDNGKLDDGDDAGTSPSKDDEPTSDPAPKCGGYEFGTNACGTCAASACCSAGAACMNDKDCKALDACIGSCTNDGCIDTCVNRYPNGVDKLTKIIDCAESKCSSSCGSPPKGIGDKCTSDSQCESGSCTGTSSSPGWCTDTCSVNTQCAGSHGIANENGYLNYCLETSSGYDYCFPGCNTNSDCAKYGNGTTCQQAGSARVCSL